MLAAKEEMQNVQMVASRDPVAERCWYPLDVLLAANARYLDLVLAPALKRMMLGMSWQICLREMVERGRWAG